MNRVLPICVLSLLSILSVSAQDDSKNLHFVYIDHEVTTPVTELCEKIQQLHDDATEVDDALIVYLSDGKTSIVSFTNLSDNAGKGRDTENAFLEVIAALEDANSHDVVATEDVRNIQNLFAEYNFINSDGQITYNSVIFDFYVGGSFWNLGNNEKVISHLYESFSMFNMPRGQFSLNIYKPKREHLQYPDGKPFGDNNVDGINERIRILEY